MLKVENAKEWRKLATKVTAFKARVVYCWKYRSYINKTYYTGKFIHWLIEDDAGSRVPCRDCGNMANGVVGVKVFWWVFSFPICKKHLAENPLTKRVERAPCYITVKELF